MLSRNSGRVVRDIEEHYDSSNGWFTFLCHIMQSIYIFCLCWTSLPMSWSRNTFNIRYRLSIFKWKLVLQDLYKKMLFHKYRSGTLWKYQFLLHSFPLPLSLSTSSTLTLFISFSLFIFLSLFLSLSLSFYHK